MNDISIKESLFHSTPLKILSFLSLNPHKVFSAKEIQDETGSSKGATNQILKTLILINIVSREQKGNVYLYTLNRSNPLLKHFKIFSTLLELSPLIEEIKKYCYQIILFGSTSDGTNTIESDVDIFIKSDEKEKVRKVLRRYRYIDTNLQTVIKDPLEIASTKKEDKAFFDQVRKGITLWEGKPEDEI